ncbi:DUF6221 family protein [Streptomyces californicus]|uniref:DUF6221 family protein n=1 Tax=Streptomyces californicus TaxID=67351 RepID=UPI00381F178F
MNHPTTPARAEDVLAFLDHAIAAREEAARSSVEQAIVHLAGADPSSVGIWHVVDRPVTGTFVATSDQWDRVAEVVPTYGGAHADHIALNDPASVLRRCAADRKLIKLHGPVGHWDLGCKGCGFNNQEESMVDHYEDCPVLCTLAEGYGWTGGERAPEQPHSPTAAPQQSPRPPDNAWSPPDGSGRAQSGGAWPRAH